MKKLLFLMTSVLFVLVGGSTTRAQTSGTFPLSSSVLVSNATATLTGVTIQVTPSKLEKAGILLMPSLSCTNAGTSNVVFSFDVSPDGTTWSTTKPVTATVACNGTNAVVGAVNIAASALPNVQYLRLTSIETTQTNTVTISSVKYYMISP